MTVAAALTPVHAEDARSPRGVILVMVDDMSYGDIDALYPSSLETPKLDALYRQSVRLTDFHVGTTCSPSRASLHTGRAINAGGVWHTIAGREILRENEQTMAEVFRANGWRTGIFGKWHLGEGYPFSPRFRGFDVSVIHGGGGVGQGPDYWGNDYYSGVDEKGKPTTADFYFENGKPIKADRYCTDYWFERAQSFIRQSVKDTKRFFCYIPTNAAHGPFNEPFGFKDGFDGLVENIDANMGKLDAFLESEAIKDDVLVIFTADNGTESRRLGGLRGRKGSRYDGGHNVPCFWRWKRGGIGGSADTARDIRSLTAAMDVLPTFMDLFGLARPAGGLPLHGVSLKEMFRNPHFARKSRTVVVDTQRRADLIKWRHTCVMRDEVVDGAIAHKWRLIRKSADEKIELYDFLVDRDTDSDIAMKHRSTVDALSTDYESWWSTVSRGADKYPAFVLDEGHESELTLHSHSWIGTDFTPWHQQDVQRAAEGNGTHPVRFDLAGRYRFELRRWPREDGGAISGGSSSGQGKTIPVKKARITVTGVGNMTKPVDPGSSSVIFEMDVPRGEPTTIVTALLDDKDEVIAGAYYVYIRRIGERAESKGN